MRTSIQAQIEANLRSLAKIKVANKWMRDTLASVRLPIPLLKEEGDTPPIRWVPRLAVDAWDYYRKEHWAKEHRFHKAPIEPCPWCNKSAKARYRSAYRRERMWNLLGAHCALCKKHVYPYTRAKFVKLFGGRSRISQLHPRADESEIRREYAILCLPCYRDGGRERLWRRGVERGFAMGYLHKQGRKPSILKPQDVKTGRQVLVSRPQR